MVLKLLTKSDSTGTDIEHLAWFEGNLISSDSGGSIKTWTPELQLLNEFKPHEEYPVYHMTVDEVSKRLFTCSSDGYIFEWACESGEWVKVNTLEGHGDSTVRRLAVSGNRLLSGDETGKIKMWESGRCIANFDVLEEVWDMIAIDTTLITVRTGDIVVHELMDSNRELYRCCTKKVIPGRPPLCLIDDKLCCVDRNGTGVMVATDFKSQSPKFEKFHGHELIVNSITGTANRLYSGGWDKKVIAWDVNTSQQIGVLEVTGCINTLSLKPDACGSILYTAGENGVINVIQAS